MNQDNKNRRTDGQMTDGQMTDGQMTDEQTNRQIDRQTDKGQDIINKPKKGKKKKQTD